MTIIKSFFIAFSIYSKIPMPQFEWKEKDMEYSLCFFPWVGVVIGIIDFLWLKLAIRLGLGPICVYLITAAIPVIISGGFHVDGFMDTMDALHSYQPREKKLEILKDSHIGAFAVITLVVYYMVYIAAVSQIVKPESFVVFCLGFYMSRILSGIGVVTIPSAKKNGMLHTFATSASEKVVKWTLGLQLVICAILMVFADWKTGIIVLVSGAFTYIYYVWKSKKEFGGITGDLAGFFVTIFECVVAIAAAVGGMV